LRSANGTFRCMRRLRPRTRTQPAKKRRSAKGTENVSESGSEIRTETRREIANVRTAMAVAIVRGAGVGMRPIGGSITATGRGHLPHHRQRSVTKVAANMMTVGTTTNQILKALKIDPPTNKSLHRLVRIPPYSKLQAPESPLVQTCGSASSGLGTSLMELLRRSSTLTSLSLERLKS
jgi:hypothetical protein